MSLKITHVASNFSSSPQIAVEDVASIAEQGFKTIVNCRPDGEGGAAQPTSEQIRQAAEQHGLKYFHFPIVMGSSPAQHAQVAATQLGDAPKPILGFCKSGMRATGLYQAFNAQSAPEKTLMQWLKSKCLITRLWRKCCKKQ
jgi:uncharacterized protein (TIGR01244 family)